MTLHSVSVTGIVLREDGRVLAIKREDDGRWVPPGGVLELSESPEEGVIREVLEETGVKVTPLHLTGVYKNMRLGVVTLAFLCAPIEGTAHPTPEATEVAWLTPADASRLMPEARAARVLDALSPTAPHVRTHDGHRLL
ncbi:NUDIX domain-containing protein [Actinocorallia lasiicapitis]